MQRFIDVSRFLKITQRSPGGLMKNLETPGKTRRVGRYAVVILILKAPINIKINIVSNKSFGARGKSFIYWTCAATQLTIFYLLCFGSCCCSPENINLSFQAFDLTYPHVFISQMIPEIIVLSSPIQI